MNTQKRVAAVVATLAGIILAPVVLTPVLHAFLPFPFQRIFTRVLMASALIGAVALGGLRRATLERVGLAWTKRCSRSLGVGAAAAVSLLLAHVAVAVLAGHGEWALRDRTAWQWTTALASALATGALVGLAEEYLFRGIIFTFVRDRLPGRGPFPAMAVTSALFALLHFLRVPTPDLGSSPGLDGSLQLALAPVRALADWQATWPSAVGLFLLGLVLNDCVARTRSLYPSIGLHAGGVLFIRLVKSFVRFPAAGSIVWGTYLVYDGVTGWVIVLAMGFVARSLFKDARRPHEDPRAPVPAHR